MQRWSTVVYDGKQRKGKLENWPVEFLYISNSKVCIHEKK